MAPFASNAQRKYLFAKEPDLAAEFAKATPKEKKLPERLHPAMKQAFMKFGAAHGHKFAANAGRGFKRKSA